MTISRLKAIDLFCGCGGISAGLRDANFRVIAGVDIEPKYMATFQHNFRETRSLNADLTKYIPTEIMAILGIEPGELDLLAGGPPCQGFSKNVPRKYRYMHDTNNLLVRTFLDYCEALEPNLILMENVAEMKNGFSQQFSDEVVERLDGAGYSVTPIILNAAEYGIPQRRRRAFFLAARGTTPLESPIATHYKEPLQIGLLDNRAFVNVWEAIGDLPSLHHGEGHYESEYACEAFSDYQRKMRSSSGKVRNHIARRLEPTQYARLASLQPGQGHKDLPDNLKVRGGYSGAYGRLTKEMIAPTITRWVFHPGSGRWGHPVDTRTLTIREVARIQGFNDDYEFVGSFVQQAGQIGNAVPPLLIKQIGLSMRQQLGV
ncbi:MAG: DNA cytosine methyltransferase [Chloroflexi bacterium]|nr:DNA cytosine methyltransferase [Chloroflexota bacterium]